MNEPDLSDALYPEGPWNNGSCKGYALMAMREVRDPQGSGWTQSGSLMMRPAIWPSEPPVSDCELDGLNLER